jgi:transglutaminase-like putative cysteine protease
VASREGIESLGFVSLGKRGVHSSQLACATRCVIGVWWLALPLSCLLLLYSRASWAAPVGSGGPIASPTPAWVLEETTNVAHVEPSQGIEWQSMDFQTRFEKKQRWLFIRGREKVVSPSGIQVAGRRTFEWTPPHQSLHVHRLELVRAGAVVRRVNVSEISVLQRETSLENDIYDGNRTALALIADVRVGDEVYYEYSIVGSNPVYAGHYMTSWTQQMNAPIGYLRQRITSDAPLFFRGFGGASVSERKEGEVYFYDWEGRALASSDSAPNVPSEYDVYPWVQFSDFGSWQELSVWATSLFATNTREPTLRALVDTIRREANVATNEQFAAAALEYVQERIRYTSIALGENSHRPTAPEQVLLRGYGDCKDKSLLLVSLLRVAGIEADVALVRSTGGHGLNVVLPSIVDFDHVIVRVLTGGSAYWVDPTSLYQRGPLERRQAGEFGYALIVAPGTVAPTAIVQQPNPEPEVRAIAHYTSDTFEGDVKLESTITYSGVRAERLRGMHASMGADEFGKSMALRVKHVHADAVAAKSAYFSDDPIANTITVSLDYELGPLAKLQDNGDHTLSIPAAWLAEVLDSVAPDRKHPLQLTYPERIEQLTTIHLGPLEIEPETAEVVAAGLDFRYSAAPTDDSGIRLEHRFTTTRRVVAPEQFAAYREAKDRISERFEYYLLRDAPIPHQPWPPWWIMGVVLAALAGAFVLVWRIERAQPELPIRAVYTPHLAGRGGWLILVGFGICLSPFLLIRNAWDLPATIGTSTWLGYRHVNEPGGLGWLLRPLVLFDVVGNLLQLVVSVYLVYAFFALRRVFPWLYVRFLWGTFAFALLDSVLAWLALPVTNAQVFTKDDMRLFLVTLTWSTYAYRSRRMRSTFLPPLERARVDTAETTAANDGSTTAGSTLTAEPPTTTTAGDSG